MLMGAQEASSLIILSTALSSICNSLRCMEGEGPRGDLWRFFISSQLEQGRCRSALQDFFYHGPGRRGKMAAEGPGLEANK